MNNSEVCWDDFVEFCEAQGINLEHEDDWGIWFECWETAIKARLAYQHEMLGGN